MDFGRYLTDLRQQKGLSIYRLSKESNVSHSYISQLERGLKETPSPEVLKKLSGPLETPYMVLMAMAGHIPSEETNKRWAAALQQNSIEAFLKRIRSQFKNGELSDNVINKLKNFLDKNKISNISTESFLIDLSKFGDLLKRKLIEGEESVFIGSDIERLLNENRNLMYVQQFLYNEYLQDTPSAAPYKTDIGASEESSSSSNLVNTPSVVTSIELTEILDPNSETTVHFKNRILSQHDLQRIIDMLNVLFPDYRD